MKKNLLVLLFTISIATVFAQPANDDCNGAVTLTSQTSCSNTSGTVANATADGFSQATCDAASSSLGAGVFYKFTAVATTQTITVTPTGTLDAVVVLYSGGCFNLQQVACIDQAGGNGVVTTLTANNLTIGTQYTIRVYDYGAANATSGGFSICVTHQCQTPAPPTGIDNGGNVCQSSTATYFIGATGAGSSNWHWYSGSCGGNFISTGDHIEVSEAQPGTITYYVRTETSCGNSNCLSATVTVTASITPAVSISPASPSVCAGQTVTFTATPTNGGNPTYKWYLDNQLVSGATSATYTTAALTNNATVYCVMRSTASCTEPDDDATSSTINITVNPVPPVSVTASPTSVIAGQSVTLTASGASTYTWSAGSGNPNTQIPASTTTYTVTGTSNGCSATASVTVTITPTGVNDMNVFSSFIISPNPSTGNFTLSFETEKAEEVQLKIFDAIGQLVKEETPIKVSGAYSKQINLANAAKGIYILQLKAGSQTINKRVEIQ